MGGGGRGRWNREGKGKGREEKRGGRTLGGGLCVLLLLLFVEEEELVGIVELASQAEHFPIQTIILLVILSEELVSLLLRFGNLLL